MSEEIKNINTDADIEEAQAETASNLPVKFGYRPEADVIRVTSGQFGVQGSGDTSGFGGLQQAVTAYEPATRPYGSWFDLAVDALIDCLQKDGLNPAEVIEKVVVEHEELTLFVNRSHLVEVMKHLRDDQDLRFEFCVGVNGVHYPNLAGREIHAVYQLMSITHGSRSLRVETSCPDADPHIPSVVSVYPGNDWHERETFDFFGIIFDGHPHLTRSAMPDDWVGHPQRKDYPLGGIPVEYKGAVVPPADTRRAYS